MCGSYVGSILTVATQKYSRMPQLVSFLLFYTLKNFIAVHMDCTGKFFKKVRTNEELQKLKFNKNSSCVRGKQQQFKLLINKIYTFLFNVLFTYSFIKLLVCPRRAICKFLTGRHSLEGMNSNGYSPSLYTFYIALFM